MTDSLQTWAARLAGAPLPILAATRDALRRALAGDDTTSHDLEAAARRDPGLALAVFRWLAGVRRPGAAPPDGLAHALALLGTRALPDRVAALPVVEPAAPGEKQPPLLARYGELVHAAAINCHFAARAGHLNPDEPTVCALTQQLALTALTAAAPDVAAQIVEARQRGAGVPEAAGAVLGCDLQALGELLAQRWGLPEAVADAQRAGAGRGRANASRLAEALAAAAASEGWYGERMAGLTAAAAGVVGCTPCEMTADLHRVAAEAARELHGLGLRIPVWGLVDSEPPPASEGPEPDAPQAPAQRGSPDGALGMGTLHDALHGVMSAMQREAGVTRVLFAMLTQDRQALKARFVLGAAPDAALRGFAAPMAQQNLFSLLMRKPQALWLHPGNASRYVNLLGAGLRQSVSEAGFYTASLFVRGRPVGLFYGDALDADPLGEGGFEAFRQLSQRAASLLGGAAEPAGTA
jgi:HD-like signal output (HDOD) protein